MPKYSAGLVPYRTTESKSLEVLIVHPGGPYWAKKDEGAWSIPKGEFDPGDDPLVAAKREFVEELGKGLPTGEYLELGELKQPSGKRIIAWAVLTDIDIGEVQSNTFEIEWPPKSGRLQSFPEVDRALWCSMDLAKSKLLKGQVPFIDRLIERLVVSGVIEFSSTEATSDTTM